MRRYDVVLGLKQVVAAARRKLDHMGRKCDGIANVRTGAAAGAGSTRRVTATPTAVGRCRLTVSNPVLKAPMVSALESRI